MPRNLTSFFIMTNSMYSGGHCLTLSQNLFPNLLSSTVNHVKILTGMNDVYVLFLILGIKLMGSTGNRCILIYEWAQISVSPGYLVRSFRTSIVLIFCLMTSRNWLTYIPLIKSVRYRASCRHTLKATVMFSLFNAVVI